MFISSTYKFQINKAWDRAIYFFIWNGQKPRIGYAILQIVKHVIIFSDSQRILLCYPDQSHWCSTGFLSKRNSIEHKIERWENDSSVAEMDTIKGQFEKADAIT